MEYSRNDTVIMALPLVILVLALAVALYQAGFDVEAATLPENPAGPLEETLTALLETDRPLVAGTAADYDAAAGTVTLTGSVANPTAYPLTVTALDYRVAVGNEAFIASLAAPVEVPPGGEQTVVLSGAASPAVARALTAGTVDGVLSVSLAVMGITVTSELARPWEVEA